MPGLSDTMLAQRLREMEAAGLVERDVRATTPIEVRYRLTEKGQALGPVLDALADWMKDGETLCVHRDGQEGKITS